MINFILILRHVFPIWQINSGKFIFDLQAWTISKSEKAFKLCQFKYLCWKHFKQYNLCAGTVIDKHWILTSATCCKLDDIVTIKFNDYSGMFQFTHESWHCGMTVRCHFLSRSFVIVESYFETVESFLCGWWWIWNNFDLILYSRRPGRLHDSDSSRDFSNNWSNTMYKRGWYLKINCKNGFSPKKSDMVHVMK